NVSRLCMSRYLTVQSLLDYAGECLQRHADGIQPVLSEPRIADWKNVDLGRPLGDGRGDRGEVGHPAVDELAPTDRHWREDARNARPAPARRPGRARGQGH